MPTGGSRLRRSGRQVGILILLVYRRFISPLLPQACRFYPSCSVYATEAIARHGLGQGTVLTFGRLLRCQPLCRGGYDPVPVEPRWRLPRWMVRT